MYTIGLFIIGALLMANETVAKVHECPDGQGGIFMQDAPCPGTPPATPPLPQATGQKAKQPDMPSTKESKIAWKLIAGKDEMTDKVKCIIESPPGFSRWRGGFVFITLRLTRTDAGYIMVLYSQSQLGVSNHFQDVPSFHATIEGLGIRIDKYPFIPVSLRPDSDSRLLAFLPAHAQTLVEEMQQGQEAKLRVRFWPYEQTVDTEPIPLAGFSQGLEALKECLATAK